jgi:hypothetical protein
MNSVPFHQPTADAALHGAAMAAVLQQLSADWHGFVTNFDILGMGHQAVRWR